MAATMNTKLTRDNDKVNNEQIEYIAISLLFARITEVISTSTISFDDAIKKGIERAARTLDNVDGAWVQDQKVTVENGSISEFEVTLKITFVLND